ncbi:ABC transporter permease [Georgenia subflava]|uniref:FtsX-like permease family protein n=1 Tax=Georgenia subflava TaxID=1622177 RepID=A0A6N7EIM2_9MICO|nr:FtsX-like permease family protein [Georgenia subflava]MPV36858.1 FtsX-like permease family protein [Georgenia subflava]
MLRVALREIRAHLVRFVLSVLAVTLGIAFVTGTFSLRALLSDTFSSIIASTTQGDLYVRGPTADAADDGGGGTPERETPGVPVTPDPSSTAVPAPPDGQTDVPAPPDGGEEPTAPGGGTPMLGEQRVPVSLDLVPVINGVDGVDQAVPDLLGTVVLIGADGQAVINGQAPSLGSALRENDPSGTLLAGRAPRDASEIALETTALETSGLELGDTTQVVIGNGSLTEVTVVGEVSYGNPMVGTTLVLVDAETGEQAFAPNGLAPSIAVFAEEGADLAELREDIAAALADAGGAGDVEVVTGEQVREEANETINQLLGFLSTFLLVFALISLFVGAFIIANTFAMSVRQRQREFALLRAVGASPGQVMTTVLGQAAVVGLVGSAAGIAGGIGLIAVVRTWLASMDMELGGEVVISGPEALAAVALGTGISLVAAAVPARRAATTPPVEAMRDDVVVVERSLRLRAAVGAVLLLGGTGATIMSVQEGTERAGTWLGVGAGAVLLGALAVSPAIARAVVRVLAWPFVVLLRPMGMLARGNVTRNPRRTANTSGALMIGMALVGACAVLAASAQASTSSIVATESRADFTVQSATRSVPPDAAEQIAALDEVARADTVTLGRAALTGPDGEQGTYSVAGLPAGAFGETLEVEVVAGSLDGLADGEVAVNQTAAVDEGWQVGDVVQLANGQEARVTAVIASQILGVPVVMDEALFAETVPGAGTTITAVLVDGAAGVDQDELRAALDAAAEPFVVLTVQDADELRSSLAEQVDQAMVILYALLGLSVIIAILGIVNTLALAVIERTREIGLMRAVGLGRLQLAGTITIESVLTAVYGTVLGVVVGVGLASALPTVFAEQGLTQLAIPWDLLAVMVLLSGVVGVVAALWPGARAAGLPVLEAVTHE